MARPRITIDLEADESIANQIAYQQYESGRNFDDVRDFIRRADRCTTVDQLLRVILRDYDVRIKD